MDEKAHQPSPLLGNSNVLIVEDDLLIAYDISDVLQEAGAVVSVANTVDQAFAEAKVKAFSAAVLDQGIAGGDSADLAVRLRDLGVPFLIYSGAPPDTDVDAPYLIKPAPASVLVQRVAALLEAPPDHDK